MPVKDYDILNQIEKISDHVDLMLNNAFVRKALMKVELPYEYRSGMDLLLSKSESYRVNGYLFDEIYRGILGLAMWTYRSRTDILPDLKYRLADSPTPEGDRIREQMAVDNLGSNLAYLADELNNLYVKTVKVDKDSHIRKPPVFQRIPELRDLGQYLTSDTKGLIR